MARLLSTLFVLTIAAVPCLAEEVGVSGSDTRYESEVKATVGDKP